MSIPYDLLDVTWGDEVLRARPTGWSEDLTNESLDVEEAEGIFITTYELVCPACGELCSFSISEIEIECEGCGSKTDNPSCEINPNPTELDLITLDNPFGEDEIKEFMSVGDDESEDEKPDKKPDDKKDTKSPTDILDNLTASINNAEISLEDPDEDDRKQIEKIKKSAEKKTKKKAKKKTKKK